MKTYTDIVSEGLIEFGSLTCPVVNVDRVHVLEFYPRLDYDRFVSLWKRYRAEPEVVKKYGEVSGVKPVVTGEYYTVYNVFKQFTDLDTDPTSPYYLCFCAENGDEYVIRRSLPDDKYTSGKFMTLHCQYSKDPNYVPRNRLNLSKPDHEYVLVVTHIAGNADTRAELTSRLDQYRGRDKDCN